MANIQQWTAPDVTQFEAAVSNYVAHGYLVANRTACSVTLVKPKQFSIAMLVIGLILCVVPLFLYLLLYAFEQDQVIEVRLPSPPIGQRSADGHWSWDGRAWQPVATPALQPLPAITTMQSQW